MSKHDKIVIIGYYGYYHWILYWVLSLDTIGWLLLDTMDTIIGYYIGYYHWILWVALMLYILNVLNKFQLNIKNIHF